MAMCTIEQATAAIIEIVVEVHELNTGETPTIGVGLRPIGDLPGFDSLNGVEVSMKLESRLGIEMPVDIFVREDRSLTIAEAARRVVDLSGSEETSP
jgi:acyl carrier protein